MAELEIRLDIDPKNGKRNVTIKYLSEPDALPMEHEEEHRRLVDQLIEGGALKQHELGTITVERVEVTATGEVISEGHAQSSIASIEEDA